MGHIHDIAHLVSAQELLFRHEVVFSLHLLADWFIVTRWGWVGGRGGCTRWLGHWWSGDECWEEKQVSVSSQGKILTYIISNTCIYTMLCIYLHIHIHQTDRSIDLERPH